MFKKMVALIFSPVLQFRKLTLLRATSNLAQHTAYHSFSANAAKQQFHGLEGFSKAASYALWVCGACGKKG